MVGSSFRSFRPRSGVRVLLFSYDFGFGCNDARQYFRFALHNHYANGNASKEEKQTGDRFVVAVREMVIGIVR